MYMDMYVGQQVQYILNIYIEIKAVTEYTCIYVHVNRLNTSYIIYMYVHVYTYLYYMYYRYMYMHILYISPMKLYTILG